MSIETVISVARRQPRVLLVLGTRPEAIKIAPVALALRSGQAQIEPLLCSTGQHRDMLDQALGAFNLRPDFELNVMTPGQTLAGLTARAMTELDRIIERVRPDLVLVQGDTTSAMVGALAAFYHRVPVAHLEAGLRTGDMHEPFPEEANRRLVGTLASLHFAPTARARRALEREGVRSDQIFVTGNTVIDALLNVLRTRDRRRAEGAMRDRRVLLTMHRRESFGSPLENICRAVRALVDRNPGVEVVFPVHASPFVREPVQRLLGNHPQIALGDPLGYQDFVKLLDSSYLVLTDSGGIQEEAPALGKPVLVLRNKTERPEAIRAGTACLVGTRTRRVLEATEKLLHDEARYQAMAHAENPYGDGRAAERVVAALRYYFGLAAERPLPFAPSLPERRPAELVA